MMTLVHEREEAKASNCIILFLSMHLIPFWSSFSKATWPSVWSLLCDDFCRSTDCTPTKEST